MRAITSQAARATALAAVLLAVAACGPAPTPLPTTLGQPSGTPFTPPATGPSTSPSPELTPGAGAVVEDRSLLGLLPSSIDGAQVEVEPLAFQEALAAPDFVASVESAVFVLLVKEPDLASGVVARVRRDRWSDAAFRSWRDTYDEGVCERAGGIVGRAEARIGDRVVNITRCGGAVFVYHTFLEAQGVVISLFSWGEKRYGEQLMAGINP